MKIKPIDEKISYIECSENPLSADIGIIRDQGRIWLYDVGSDETKLPQLKEECSVVISHFHQDHTGNIGRVRFRELFVSKESYRHLQKGTVIRSELKIGNIRIFSIPSSHCKGNLGMEVDSMYAFVGDALYCKVKEGYFIYNAQLLKEEIEVLKGIKAPYLLVSHYPGFVRDRAEVIGELEAIYRLKTPGNFEIKVKRDSD